MVKVSFGAPKINIAKKQTSTLSKLVGSRNVALVTGAFVGLAASLPLSVAMLSPVITSDLASNNAQPIVMRSAADNLSCIAPVGTIAGSSSSPKSQKSHIYSKPAPTSYPSSAPIPPKAKQFIVKLVGGTIAKNNAVVENNGPNGKAIVVNTNIITNTNSSVENNATDQSAKSGNVVNSGNIGASGDSASGNANNANSASFGTYQNN